MSVASFEINLDRQNGVYFAGETVRGTVKLITTSDITTRGVRIRYRGEGSMHFHTGSGDDRHDYEGGKIFEEHRYTMFGNYFNTTILDEAGADAYFGSASGDGIMYIPCNDSDHLEMIVRVMDYDFGKRDDLLGEAIVDVSELAASGAERSFPLTRNGRPEKAEVTLRARFLPMNALFPASPRSGGTNPNQHSSVCELRAIKATGLRKADFFGKNDVYVQTYRVRAQGVDRSKALPGPDTKAVLPAGTLVFPFAFPIRPDAPGTAELQVGDWAWVRYTLYANIDKAWWLDPCVRRGITVIATRPRPPPSLLLPIEYADPGPVRMAGNCCCPCWTGLGTATLRARLSRQTFASGEPLGLTVSLQNDASSPLVVSVALQRWALLATTRMRGQHQQMFRTVTPIYQESVDAGSSWSFDGTRCGLAFPPAYPSFFGASGIATAYREPVTFTYALSVTVAPPGMCAKAHTISFPIIVSAAPPTAAALAAAQSQNRPSTQQPVPEGQLIWAEPPASVADRDSYADEPAPTGQLVPVAQPVSTYIAEEDKSALAGREAQVYQPYVVSYSTTTAGPIQTASVEVKLQPSAPPAVSPVEELVSALQTGLGAVDARKTVLDWAARHPGAGATVTPENAARILHSVPMALDQTCVALEVARFLGKAHLTCAHITAACGASTFFRTEVAAAMAPYAGDSAHKAAVLAVLPSYDQEKVSQLFP